MSATELDEMFTSDEFRKYRKLLIEKIVDVIDLTKQSNEYRAGVLEMARQLFKVPSLSCSLDRRPVIEMQFAEDMKILKQRAVLKEL